MMRKLLSKTRTLLVAAALCAGASNVWADGNKRTLFAQDYESVDVTDWTITAGTATLATNQGAGYGTVATLSPSGSGNRSASTTKYTFSYELGTGKTASDMTTTGYNVEFDMLLASGNVNDRSQSQFVVPTTGPNLGNNVYYTGEDYIFMLSQKTLADGARNSDWFINDPTNATTETVTLAVDKMYHYKLVVTATSVTYTITDGDAVVKAGSKTVSTLPSITGFYHLVGRGNGWVKFDNVDIYDFTESLTYTNPTFTLKSVDGANRTYTITNPTASTTLYYTTAVAGDEPAQGDAAYSSTTDLTKDVTVSGVGNIYAYVATTTPEGASSTVSQTVNGVALTLHNPVITKTAYANNKYTVNITSDQNDLDGKPTATIYYRIGSTGEFAEYSSAIDVNEGETVYAYANATGYTDSETTNEAIGVMPVFGPAEWSIDFTGYSEDGLAYAETTFGSTYYNMVGISANFGVAAVSGSNRFYIHNGGLYVYYGGGKSFAINNLEKDDYIVIRSSLATTANTNVELQNGLSYGNTYIYKATDDGIGIFNTPRYNIFYSVEVVKPVPASVAKTITEAGWATYCSPYILDFSATIANLDAAYIVTGGEGGVLTKTAVTGAVPAGTGLLLKGSGEVTIPVAAAATVDVTANRLDGTVAGEVLAAEGGYVLMGTGANGLGFYLNSKAFTLGANSAYLPAGFDGTSAPSFFGFGDETTAISAVAAEGVRSAEVYNLAGQRVSQPTRGLYIVGGKKVVIK